MAGGRGCCQPPLLTGLSLSVGCCSGCHFWEVLDSAFLQRGKHSPPTDAFA